MGDAITDDRSCLDPRSMTVAEPIKDGDRQPQFVYGKIWGKDAFLLLKLLNCKNMSRTFQGPVKILLKNEAHAPDKRAPEMETERHRERETDRQRQRGSIKHCWDLSSVRIQPDLKPHAAGFSVLRANQSANFCLCLSELGFCHLQPDRVLNRTVGI